jgi:TonB family protein
MSDDTPSSIAADLQPTDAKRRSEVSGSTARSVTTPAKIVHGKVMSAYDEAPMPGVNVVIKGTSTGTVTDQHGNYQIALTDPEQVLVFNFIGMTSAEVRTSGKEEINVRLNEDVTSLSEVVVTGYGTSTNASGTTSTFEMAEPDGGRRSFKKYLEKNLQYPPAALENRIEGKVTVEFTVQPNGQLTDFKVVKGLGYGCDEEVIRLIKDGPPWTPSKRNEQPVQETIKVRLKFEHPER